MIKHLLILLAVLFFVAQTKAQTSVYYPFPDSNATWNETIHWYNDTCDGNDFFTMFLKGDTTVNSNMYAKLYETGYSYSAICGDTNIYFANNYIGAIRQNVLLKEVYIVLPGDTAAMLLYDFNLSLGDTLPGTYFGAANYNYVSSVDSILIGSTYRRIFGISVLDSSYVYATLVEGIGNTLGLFAPLRPPAEYFYSLNCFTQNGRTIYPDSSASCDTLTTVKEVLPGDSFSIYPNPTSGQLTVRFSSVREDAVVSIRNLLGQEVLSPTLLQRQGESTVVDVSNLPPGIYFIQITAKNARWTGKFAKD